MKRIVRRTLGGLLAVALIVFLSAFFFPRVPDVDKGGSLTTVHPAPTHLVWEYHDVSGYVLCVPPDSTGKVECSPALPEGSMIAVPHILPGEDPDSTRVRS